MLREVFNLIVLNVSSSPERRIAFSEKTLGQIHSRMLCKKVISTCPLFPLRFTNTLPGGSITNDMAHCFFDKCLDESIMFFFSLELAYVVQINWVASLLNILGFFLLFSEPSRHWNKLKKSKLLLYVQSGISNQLKLK